MKLDIQAINNDFSYFLEYKNVIRVNLNVLKA